MPKKDKSLSDSDAIINNKKDYKLTFEIDDVVEYKVSPKTVKLGDGTVIIMEKEKKEPSKKHVIIWE